jgi:uncharacterized repeat protein (TIGR01451 family)
LRRGAAATFTVSGQLDPGTTGQIDSEATVAIAPGLFDARPADNVSRASAPVTTVAQLTTGKSVAPDHPVEPGDEVEYTVTARNGGPSTARDVGAVDDLPEQLAFVGSDDGCTADGQRVTCAGGGDLAPGQEHAFRFRARLDAGYSGDGSDVVNVATATSPTDPDGGEESPEVPIEVVEPDGPGGPDGPGDPDGPGGTVGPGDPDPTVTPGPAGRPDGPGGRHGPSTVSGGNGDPGAPAPRGPGALAYTGAQGLGLAGLAGIVLAGTGTAVWLVRRRRPEDGAGGSEER